MGFRYEMRLSGSGGQGLILAGIIIGEAAAVHAGLHAAQSQSYGPEARGGASRSEVIISDDEVDYPKATEVDLLLAMTQESCNKYAGDLKSDGLLIVDSTFVKPPAGRPFRVVEIPISDLAAHSVGRLITANIVALGAISVFCSLVPFEAIKASVMAQVPPGTEALNERALETGRKAALELTKA